MIFNQFLKETLWVLYALYFQPTKLGKLLRASAADTHVHSIDATLPKLLGWLDRQIVRHYLLQLTLFSILAALPFWFLAPTPTQPFILKETLFTFIIIVLAGLGAALWRGGLGPTFALTLALLLGNSEAPFAWLEAFIPATVLSDTQDIPIRLSIGLAVGLLFGGAGKLLFPYWPKSWRTPIGSLVSVATLVTTLVIANRVVVGTVDILLLGLLVGITLNILGDMAGVLLLVLSLFMTMLLTSATVDNITSLGMVFELIFVMILSIAGGIASVILLIALRQALFIVLAIAAIIATATASAWAGVPGDALFIFVFAIVLALTLVVQRGNMGITASFALITILTVSILALVSILIIIFILSDLANASPLLISSSALILGFGLGAYRWHWRDAMRPLAFLSLLSLFFLPESIDKTILWVVAGILGFTRLPLMLLHGCWSIFGYARCRWGDADPLVLYSKMPWHWDELIPLPLPHLGKLLVMISRQDRSIGLAYIEEALGSWSQEPPAQWSLIQLTADELMNRDNEHALANATADLAWLPEMLPPTVTATLGRFRDVSRMVDDKLITTDSEAQLVKLSAAAGALDELITGLTFVPAYERELFLPIAQSWRTVLRKTTGRLPNPYVAGDPLRASAMSLFVGREDLLHQLETHLRDRSQRPTLLLFGQRRMGKSTLLYQLADRLSERSVPIRVDCQAGEMQESNEAFLFNLARAIHTQANTQRGLTLPVPPILAEMSFTSFSLWLESVEQALEGRTLLIGLDEFEALGNAVNKGWLDERVLGFLRNLIQHHPKIDLLMAGSHRPQEVAQPWSSYLISANVLEISYLEPKETRRLIQRPIPGFGLHYQPKAVEHIIRLTRCQPLLVQLLCQEVVHMLNERGEREAGVAEIEAAVPRALERGNSLYFNYLREYDAGSVGDAILKTIAEQGPDVFVPIQKLTRNDPEREQVLTRLLTRNLIEQVDGGIRFEIELVRRWWAVN